MQIEVPAAGPQVDLSNSLYAVFLAAEHVGRNGNVLERLPNGGGRRPRSALCVDGKKSVWPRVQRLSHIGFRAGKVYR